MEYLFIYGLQMARALEVLSGTAFAGLLASSVFLIIFGVGTRWNFENYDKQESYCDFSVETGKNGSKICKKIVLTCFIFTIITALLPTEQTLLLMGGTYLGKKAVNAVATSDKLEKVNTIIDLQLDKYINELQGEIK